MSKETIIITGGSQRVGLALATDLNRQGYNVIVSYRTKRPSITSLENFGIQCIQADFSSTEGIYKFIDLILSSVSQLRCLIHNASDWLTEKNSNDHNQLLDYMMQIHVKTPYLLNLKLASLLKNDAPASSDIIHLTDFVIQKGSKKHIAYAASKAALDNLTMSFAQQFAPFTKVNSIAPALLMFNEDDNESYKQKALGKSLMQLAPGPNEVIHAVNFILNSRYMTGQRINLEGGRALK